MVITEQTGTEVMSEVFSLILTVASIRSCFLHPPSIWANVIMAKFNLVKTLLWRPRGLGSNTPNFKHCSSLR